jgi:hypothetical protein
MAKEYIPRIWRQTDVRLRFEAWINPNPGEVWLGERIFERGINGQLFPASQKPPEVLKSRPHEQDQT